MKLLFQRLSSLLLASTFAGAALLTGCSTFKTTYNWEFYTRETCKAEEEGWTRNAIRSSFPDAVVLSHSVVGVNPQYGIVGKEVWRIDPDFVAEIQFVYRVNIPGGVFQPVKDFVIHPGTGRLPESRPDDRVVDARVVVSPVRVVTEHEVYTK